MTFLKRLIIQCILCYKNVRYFLYKPQKVRYTKTNITYFSQFASPELIKDFLNGTKQAIDDPRWQLSGANSREEYAIWAWNGCGMACLQMILSAEHKKIPFVILGKKCIEYYGYTFNEVARKNKDYKNYYNGLFYKPFVTFIKKEFDLKGTIVSPMIYKEIIQALDTGKYVIVSVNPAIRNPQNIPCDTKGHLVLVVGYNMNTHTFYFHNPSGIYKESQKFAQIHFQDFQKFFRHRGIVISHK